MIFPNRSIAGRLLAERLAHHAISKPLVLALPRGGVPVGAEIAKALGGELDILIVKRVVSPKRPELALGAVSEIGIALWQSDILEHLEISREEADLLADEKMDEICGLACHYRKDQKAKDPANRTVILVDDGLATGSTMSVAIQTLKKSNPARIIVAVPVAPASTATRIRGEVDELVVLSKPDTFHAVGQWYLDFSEVSDEEVSELLKTGHSKRPAAESSDVLIPEGKARLPGILTAVPGAKATVIFAHGSASTHKSPRNQRVAATLNQAGFSTLLFDLLTESEAGDRENVFDIDLLARRLTTATKWIRERPEGKDIRIGYFGASSGGAAAIAAAASDPSIYAVVSRGGRPDLAGANLERVQAPVLLIVGGADTSIIPLNVDAAKRIPKSQMVTVPGATHLFEEPGALEQVAEYAADWFTISLASRSGKETPSPRERISRDLLTAAKPYRTGKDLDAWFQKLGRARVVMLGESTHGTHEYYETRRNITERLVRDHGFSFVAVEGDWPDCYRLTEYIRSGKGKSAKEVLDTFQRWPTWLWNNAQTALLAESLKKSRTPFYGLDLYSMYESVDAIRKVEAKLNPSLAAGIRGVHACFDPHRRSETEYARHLMANPEGCEREITQLLGEILRTRIDEVKLTEDEFYDAKRNAVIVRNAERYYRAMVYGGPDSWNVRDSHMMDTLDSLLRQSGESAKAVVWAHNTHIGDFHATDMVKEGYVNLGGLARERYGVEAVHLVGFGTYEGTVLAGRAWGAPPEVMSVPPAIADSYEQHLHDTAMALGAPSLLLPDLGSERLPSLSEIRGNRAIGVVYQSQDRVHHRNYVPTSLARRYDSFVFIDRTTALKVPAFRDTGRGRLPETWPSGM